MADLLEIDGISASYGRIQALSEVSLKVLPKPRQVLSLRLEMDVLHALNKLAEWGQQPLPISAASHDGAALHLRLEGGEGSVTGAHDRLGGEALRVRLRLVEVGHLARVEILQRLLK